MRDRNEKQGWDRERGLRWGCGIDDLDGDRNVGKGAWGWRTGDIGKLARTLIREQTGDIE